MKNIFKNWKTTLAGIATILGGLAATIKFALAGDYGAAFTTLSTTIPTGIGLITAKDGNVTGL